jgi:hypothetical protein
LEEERVRSRLLEEHRDGLQTQLSCLESEQKALEQDLLALLTHQNLCSCPERRSHVGGLCGRAILYVGGRSNLVQHYRKLVEHKGGTFLYHDGGQQDNLRRLPDLLQQADDVCCPIDCVSHDATMRIKRECRRTQTEQHLIRSSGLSSFARVLSDLSAATT